MKLPEVLTAETDLLETCIVARYLTVHGHSVGFVAHFIKHCMDTTMVTVLCLK